MFTDPIERRSLDDYPPATRAREPKLAEPEAAMFVRALRPVDLRDRQIEALTLRLRALGVPIEEIAAIMTAAAEPYVEPGP